MGKPALCAVIAAGFAIASHASATTYIYDGISLTDMTGTYSIFLDQPASKLTTIKVSGSVTASYYGSVSNTTDSPLDYTYQIPNFTFDILSYYGSYTLDGLSYVDGRNFGDYSNAGTTANSGGTGTANPGENTIPPGEISAPINAEFDIPVGTIDPLLDGNRNILRFVLGYSGDQGGSAPVAVGGDGSGTIYSAPTSGSFRIALTFDSAVPEPASWAFFLSGFGLVGRAMRHRRRLPTSA